MLYNHLHWHNYNSKQGEMSDVLRSHVQSSPILQSFNRSPFQFYKSSLESPLDLQISKWQFIIICLNSQLAVPLRPHHFKNWSSFPFNISKCWAESALSVARMSNWQSSFRALFAHVFDRRPVLVWLWEVNQITQWDVWLCQTHWSIIDKLYRCWPFYCAIHTKPNMDYHHGQHTLNTHQTLSPLYCLYSIYSLLLLRNDC